MLDKHICWVFTGKCSPCTGQKYSHQYHEQAETKCFVWLWRQSVLWVLKQVEALAEQDCFWCWSSASKTVNAHCHTRRCMYHMLECRSENCKLSSFMPAPLPPPHLRWNLEGSVFSYSSSHVWSPHFPLNGIRLDQSTWLVPVFIVSSTVVMLSLIHISEPTRR